jgi:hypothetical protein
MRKTDLSIFRDFEIPLEILFDVIQEALYFDLPELTNICAKQISSNFHCNYLMN